MKKISVAGVVLAILACCFLSGCSGVLKNERMDQEVEQVIAALNEDDAGRIFQSMYPGVITREKFDESYEDIRKLWKKSDSHTTKLNAINTKKTLGSSGDSFICEAQYYVYTQEDYYTINLTYVSDENGDGLYGCFIKPGAEPLLVSGSFTTAGENSVLQWIILFLGVLSYLLIVITVVDILRKRPRLFGLWLLAVLTFFSFRIQNASDNFFVGISVNWFVMPAYQIYNNGSFILFLAFPVGAIVYWCLRKRLKQRKQQIETKGIE